MSLPSSSSSPSRIAALQMISGNDVATNLASAARLIARAADAGAQLLVLPEAFALFGSGGQRELALGEMGAQPRVRDFLAEQAQRYGVWIVSGTIPLLDTPKAGAADKAASSGSELPRSSLPRPQAACLLIDSSGNEVARYNKIHLFDVDVGDRQGSYRESDTYSPGDAVVVADTPFGRLGLAVCYDLRFAELFQLMRERGAEIIALPSAFTRKTGLAHWLPLLRARAIETQCYVIGANQGGIHTPKRQTSGGSVIIDSWGNVCAEAGFGECVIIADVDREKIQRERAAMPVQQHRRFKIIPN
ncbi:MAG: carbon-nitrogen hydrolase family protein [Spongiibacteraceae bacterium]